MLFGEPASTAPSVRFQLDSAFQGIEALEKVRAARLADVPYAMAFLDMRMPPGWDGVETAERLWQEGPRLQIVFCTAYSDSEMAAELVRKGSIRTRGIYRPTPGTRRAALEGVAACSRPDRRAAAPHSQQ